MSQSLSYTPNAVIDVRVSCTSEIPHILLLHVRLEKTTVGMRKIEKFLRELKRSGAIIRVHDGFLNVWFKKPGNLSHSRLYTFAQNERRRAGKILVLPIVQMRQPEEYSSQIGAPSR